MKKFIALLLGFTMLFGLTGAVWASTPGVLTIWADATRAPILAGLSEAFTAEFGIPVEVHEVGFGDIRDRLGIAGPAGEGPDIIIGAHDWIGQLIADGLLEPILFLEDIRDQFVPVAIEAFSSGGRIYGLPYLTEAVGLIYNRDLVLVPPATFTEFIAIASALTDPEKGQFGFLSNIPQPDPYHAFPFISAFGGYVFGLDEEGVLDPRDIGLDNEGAIIGGHLILELITSGLLPVGTDYGAMTGLFNDGMVGMILTGPWAVRDIKAAGINYGIAPLPTIGGQAMRPFVGVHGFMVSAFSANKILAMTFLEEFIATKDTMLALYEADPRNPAFIPALDVVAADPDVVAWAANAAVGTPMPSIPEMGAVWTAWADALLLIVTEEVSPEDALRDAVMRIRAVIGYE
ncbi:maltose ABC transporter substrate-binding protein [Candidatus Bipolaricaulota bacterium]|nr:maltose ABC transporter substrate-binding protein [Candidatus Bipolaricaulota bacterium]HBR09674.1 maltose ABC transporter substrate-binding protein [Candidatus Acetothermia bacterium]